MSEFLVIELLINARKDVCGFLKPPESDQQWKVRQHGAFSILHEALGIRPTDQSCHHEAWLNLTTCRIRPIQPFIFP